MQKILTLEQIAALPSNQLWIEVCQPKPHLDPQITHPGQKRYQLVENYIMPISRLRNNATRILEMVARFNQSIIITKGKRWVDGPPKEMLGYIMPIGVTFEQVKEIEKKCEELMSGKLAEVDGVEELPAAVDLEAIVDSGREMI